MNSIEFKLNQNIRKLIVKSCHYSSKVKNGQLISKQEMIL